MSDLPPNSKTLVHVSGIGNSKAGALRGAGYRTIGDLQKASQSELANVEGIGSALAARIKADVGDAEVESSAVDIEPPQVVFDREGSLWGIACSEPYGSAKTVATEDGKLIAEYEMNKDYPEDDPVVDVVPARNLVDIQSTPKRYTYPVSRLDSVDLSQRTVSAEVERKVVDAVGECEYCGDPITTEQDEYIERPSGEPYCDIGCLNAEVASDG